MYVFACACRYLRARPITWISMTGVALGVAALIVVLSVMEGFQHDLRARIRGTLADIVVRPRALGDVAALLAAVEAVPGVGAAAPRVRTVGILKSPGQYMPINLTAVDPVRETEVSDVPAYLARAGRDRAIRDAQAELASLAHALPEGPAEDARALAERLADLPTGAAADAVEAEAARLLDALPEKLRPEGAARTVLRAVAGLRRAVAESAEARDRLPFKTEAGTTLPMLMGEELHEYLKRSRFGAVRGGLELVTGRPRTPADPPGESRVVDQRSLVEVLTTYRSGQLDFDQKHGLVPLDRAVALGLVPRDGVSEVAVRVKPGQDLDAVKAALVARFPAAEVQTWMEQRGALLRAVRLEKAFLAVVLFMIVVVAGFVMLATFLTMVVQKTRDLGILRALGARPLGVAAIFTGTAVLLALVGGTIGTGLGVFVVRHINEICAALDRIGASPFPSELYYMEGIPTVLDPAGIARILLPTLGVSVLLGGILPAWRAARLDPLEAVRNG